MAGDYGHYGPFFIRMAWHARRTYRIFDGRGGARQRRNSASRAQQLARQRQLDRGAVCCGDQAKYGHELSWSDLLVLAGNVALDSMGFKTFASAAVARTLEPQTIEWVRSRRWLGDERYSGERELAHPFGRCRWDGSTSIRKAERQPDPSARRATLRDTFAPWR